MKPRHLLRPALLAAVTVAASVGFSGGAQAGLFDFLFGGQQPRYSAPPPSYADGAPLDVRVNSRKKKDATKAVKAHRERKPVVQTSIDPAKHPNWYLEDSTLRKGDIVVLKTGVMVYNGGARPQTREDFTALSKSRLVSKSERERIEKMAPVTTAEATESPAAGKEASLDPTPIR